tara:strand:+ start:86 stop:1165 length:1080 start_codon:yes stop_codon:yes gene_type:complete
VKLRLQPLDQSKKPVFVKKSSLIVLAFLTMNSHVKRLDWGVLTIAAIRLGRKANWLLLAGPICLAGCLGGESEVNQPELHSGFDAMPSLPIEAQRDTVPRKRSLLEEAGFENTSYAIYADLISRGRDTSKAYGWSVEGISIERDGELQLSLYQKEFFVSVQDLLEGGSEVHSERLDSDSSRILLRLDCEYSPSAPGQEVIALVQLRPDQIQTSDLFHIEGRFENRPWGVDGIRWTGFFAVEWPYRLNESGKDLTLSVDTSRLQRHVQGQLLRILDGNRRPPTSSLLELVDNPFASAPTVTSLTIHPEDSVKMIHMATDGVGSGRFLDAQNHWIQIEVAGQTGWVKGMDDLLKIGCQPSG